MHTDALPLLKADEYPGGLWYYEPHTYQPYRYVPAHPAQHIAVGQVGVGLVVPDAAGVFPRFQAGQLFSLHENVPHKYGFLFIVPEKFL